MARIKTILVSATLGFTLAAGIAFAQGFIPGVDPELRAAQQSLVAAMAHLQRTNNPELAQIIRARAYIVLAETELDPVSGAYNDPGLRPR
jgi:hypothetical protein